MSQNNQQLINIVVDGKLPGSKGVTRDGYWPCDERYTLTAFIINFTNDAWWREPVLNWAIKWGINWWMKIKFENKKVPTFNCFDDWLVNEWFMSEKIYWLQHRCMNDMLWVPDERVVLIDQTWFLRLLLPLPLMHHLHTRLRYLEHKRVRDKISGFIMKSDERWWVHRSTCHRSGWALNSSFFVVSECSTRLFWLMSLPSKVDTTMKLTKWQRSSKVAGS